MLPRCLCRTGSHYGMRVVVGAVSVTAVVTSLCLYSAIRRKRPKTQPALLAPTHKEEQQPQLQINNVVVPARTPCALDIHYADEQTQTFGMTTEKLCRILSSMSLHERENIIAIPQWIKVSQVDLGDGRPVDAVPFIVQHCPHLQKLQLAFWSREDGKDRTSLPALSELKHLRSLKLDHAYGKWYRLSDLPALPTLESLDILRLPNNKDEKELDVLNQFKGLRELTIGTSPAPCDDAFCSPTLRCISKLTKLEKLGIFCRYGYHLEEHTPIDISALRKMPELRELQLANAYVSDFSPLAECKKLSTLRLDHNWSPFYAPNGLRLIQEFRSLRLVSAYHLGNSDSLWTSFRSWWNCAPDLFNELRKRGVRVIEGPFYVHPERAWGSFPWTIDSALPVDYAEVFRTPWSQVRPPFYYHSNSQVISDIGPSTVLGITHDSASTTILGAVPVSNLDAPTPTSGL